MAKKCPLCGEKLKNNYCDSCGYAVPDDDELSALYNLDPSDYPQPQEQPAVREITPEVQAEEIYPNRPEAPRFKVRDDEGKTVQGDYGQNAQSADPYAGQYGQQTPPPSYYANDAGRTSPPSPYANTGNTGNTRNAGGNFNTEILKEFAKKYWWYWLVLFFAPWLIAVCLTFALMRNSVVDQKYRWILIVSLIISFILPPW